MYILHFPARTSVLKNGRLNERRNHEQEDNSFDLCGGYAADGAWIYVRGADFGYGASAFTAEP